MNKLTTYAGPSPSNHTLIVSMWVALALVIIVATWTTAYDMGAADKAAEHRAARIAQVRP